MSHKGAKMDNRLVRSIRSMEDRLVAKGFAVTYIEGVSRESSGVNLDSERFVGTIAHWPESRFEFQFNRCDTGEVEVLESHEFDSDETLIAYLGKLLFERLS